MNVSRHWNCECTKIMCIEAARQQKNVLRAIRLFRHARNARPDRQLLLQLSRAGSPKPMLTATVQYNTSKNLHQKGSMENFHSCQRVFEDDFLEDITRRLAPRKWPCSLLLSDECNLPGGRRKADRKSRLRTDTFPHCFNNFPDAIPCSEEEMKKGEKEKTKARPPACFHLTE